MQALTGSTTFVLPRDIGLQCCHLNTIKIFGKEVMDKVMGAQKAIHAIQKNVEEYEEYHRECKVSFQYQYVDL